MKKISLVCIVVFLLAFATPPRKMKIWLVGDSTMANKETKAYPETGWGMPFTYFFDSTVIVDNRAMNGRSTRSFIEEKRWEAILTDMQEGDYVLIQFGHNDEVPTKKNATTPEQFRNYLIQYITETSNKKAVPVLITPVTRRSFDSTGKLTDTHEAYANIVRAVAKEKNVQLIDLDKSSMALVQSMGVENSKFLFNYLAAGEHPNYPEGKEDNTHFSELGARKMAELVLKDIKDQHVPIADKIVVGKNKK